MLKVLYEDNHLLAIDKPAGLATMGTPEGEATLLTLARDYIKEKYQKPGNVYLGIMSRLDAPVTGIVLLARTSKAAARMTEQFRTRSVRKVYWALVESSTEQSGSYTDWLEQDERHRRMHIVGPTMPGAKEARLHYKRLYPRPDGKEPRLDPEVLRAGSPRNVRPQGRKGLLPPPGEMTLIEIELETGRKHQIRLQMSHHGHPIIGDRKYGSRFGFPAGIALHSGMLQITHPVRGDRLTFEAPLPASWPRPLAAFVESS